MNEIILTEHIEQVQLANWLRANGYTFYKSPSETFTKSWNQKRKNTLEGVCKGYPDVTIILKNKRLLFIELKRAKKSLSKVSKEQLYWQEKLNEIENVQCEICYGSEQAIKTILLLEKEK